MQPEYRAPKHTSAKALRSSLILLLTAFIWGIAFVAQRVGMNYIGPFLFASLRFILGALFLVLVLILWRKPRDGGQTTTDNASERLGDTSIKQLIKPGVICGCFLFMGAVLQQVGLVYTGAAKAGFLTALYIVLVPVLGMLLRHRTHWNTWVGVALAVVGLYCLSITETMSIQPGDIVVICGAFFWAGHILSVDRFVGDINQRDVLRFCVVQFFFAGCVALVLSFVLDRFFVVNVFDLAALKSAAIPILYAGVMSTGVAFTFQAIGQQGLPASAAAIIMSLEAVFSVLGGMVILSEILTGREAFGCVLMFVAVIIAQLPGKAV
ncbi:MAG: DMT family transporter [Coriobacteriia bacterium]|nr:DMT family transporter [Coriobacteriia bacterium]